MNRFSEPSDLFINRFVHKSKRFSSELAELEIAY